MIRKIIFKHEAKQKEIVLPVSNATIAIDRGINIETVNIQNIGDVALPGFSTSPEFKIIDALLPRQAYSFNNPETVLNPFYYIEQFEIWSDAGDPVRYMISDTPINCKVLISGVHYEEKDGTNDLYLTLYLRRYRDLTVQTVSKSTKNATRAAEKGAGMASGAEQRYLIRRGDTLSSISRKFYGSAAHYPLLASYNGIQNPNLIYAGHTIKIPSLKTGGGG